MSQYELESHLDAIAERALASDDDAWQALLDATAAVNGLLQAQPAEPATFLRADVTDRLGSAVKKFEETVKTIASKVGASDFSVTVGYPWGVSVTVNWPVPKDGGEATS